MATCSSCGQETNKGVSFPCPKCNEKITRCDRCRELSIEYQCKCGFKGP
ncbi:MAG: zinc finger domain-containing protein [Candidatus Nanoarchaeia archaeon]